MNTNRIKINTTQEEWIESSRSFLPAVRSINGKLTWMSLFLRIGESSSVQSAMWAESEDGICTFVCLLYGSTSLLHMKNLVCFINYSFEDSSFSCSMKWKVITSSSLSSEGEKSDVLHEDVQFICFTVGNLTELEFCHTLKVLQNEGRHQF